MLNSGGYSDFYTGLYEEPKKYNDDDLARITDKLMDKLHISTKPVLVKCPACGQWAAVQTACKSCGHPVGE